MQQNILRNSNLSSIYLIYQDTVKQKHLVQLRFIDTKECYLSTVLPTNFTKPKTKTNAELVAYTEDGVYKTQVKINDISFSFNEIIYIVDAPKNWKFIQLRNSTRKECSLPFVLKFNDGYELNGVSYDLSTGGISFTTPEPLQSIYTKINGNITFSLKEPDENAEENNTLTLSVKFLRMLDMKYSKDNCYVYKFLNISKTDIDKIKTFLIFSNK